MVCLGQLSYPDQLSAILIVSCTDVLLSFDLMFLRKIHRRKAQYEYQTLKLAITNSALQLTELLCRLVSFQKQLQCTKFCL